MKISAKFSYFALILNDLPKNVAKFTVSHLYTFIAKIIHMKNMFLIAPMCALIFSCEKEEIVQNENTESTVVSTEHINLNGTDRPVQSEDRSEDIAYDKYTCALEGESSQYPTGTKCVLGTADDCYNDATTRCAASTSAFNNLVGLYLTPSEAQLFWGKTYNEQFVRANWDFFMEGYRIKELNHPENIIRNL